MDYLPIFANIAHKKCLVIGGGGIAFRKINLLLSANAEVICVAKNVSAQITKLTNITILTREFTDADINGKYLIISATNDKILNKRVANIAHKNNILVNVVDNPKLCSFIMPAIIDRSPIVVAVSSMGSSPVLARLLRAKIESTIPAAYGKLAILGAEFRDAVKAKFSNVQKRRIFWESVLSGTVAEYVFANKYSKAQQEIKNKLAKLDDKHKNIGEVYLVGGGPGDPDLLTFKALRLMQQADVVLYDRLVSDGVMALVRRDVELIYVGKERGNHSVPQGGINQLLIDLAQQGKRVCRLKGGDPFIFGRGGEEIEKLAQHNIPFQVVPGITAASGCAAYAGIPLTHRDYSQSCRFVTGHLQDGTIDLPWQELAFEKQTVVFYMALMGAKYLSKQLIAHGMRSDIAVALVERGTTEHQKVWTTTLAELPSIIANNTIHAPTLIIVGDVVKLRDKLNWY